VLQASPRVRWVAGVALVVGLHLLMAGSADAPPSPYAETKRPRKPVQKKKGAVPFTPAPAVAARAVTRDLVYRGEEVGPYHPLLLNGVPPGVRIRGLHPPSQNPARKLLVTPFVTPGLSSVVTVTKPSVSPTRQGRQR
jgi:hypothetical protein